MCDAQLWKQEGLILLSWDWNRSNGFCYTATA